MKLLLKKILFLFAIAFTLFQSGRVLASEIVIDNADMVWTADVFAANGGVTDSSGAGIVLNNEVVVCHVDQIETVGVDQIFPEALDSATASFKMPIEVQVCHADSILNGGLAAFDVVTPPEPKKKFVYVALGDSYQSGEGAGNSIADTNKYLADAYEQATYTPGVVTGGDSCHRALENYAKLIANKLDPTAEVILIDETCSGAKIESGLRPSIVGDITNTYPGGIDPNSQLAQAIKKLDEDFHLTPSDVNLVTVGMGGNDAKFADLVSACVAPNILQQALQKYPGPPIEVSLLANFGASCKLIDDKVLQTEGIINNLQSKEFWAQNKILKAFTGARVLQLNYPNILPQNTNDISWCSGIKTSDIEFARDKATAINQKIKTAYDSLSANNERFKLVDMANTLGSNALCSGTLANSINQNNFNTEIERLVSGNSQEPIAFGTHNRLDTLKADYDAWKACIKTRAYHYKNLGVSPDCDVDVAWAKMVSSGKGLMDYLASDDAQKVIFANLISADGGGESVAVRFDRSRGLFHPNAKGHMIQACNVLSAYNNTDASLCFSYAPAIINDTVDGNPMKNLPIDIAPHSQQHLAVGGFGSGAPVLVTIGSTLTNLGTFTADSNGVVNATITLPDVGPGVHTITLEGDSEGGAVIGKQYRVNFPGKPSGDGSYGMYLVGFSPNSTEQVDIVYYGQSIGKFSPDADGGIFIEVPLFGLPGNVEVAAKSESGQTITKTIEVADTEAPKINCGAADGQWHKDNITIACTATDLGELANDADASFSLLTNVEVGNETENAATESKTICDKAGNCVTAGPITGNKIDRKNPIIVATAGGYVSGAWTNQNVTVHFDCQDSGSGVVNCPADAIINNEGITPAVNGAVVDNAGNQANILFGPVKIDKVAPIMGLTPVSGSYDSPLTFSWNIADNSAASGVNTATCSIKIDNVMVASSCSGNKSLIAGTHSVQVSATDIAGNIGSDSRSYSVKDKTATLTVVNKVVPATDTGKFNLLIDGAVKATNVGNGTTGAVTIAGGSHTVSLSAGTGTILGDYTTVISGDCAANGVITINPGDNKACTITNTRIDTGTLTLVKKSGTANGTFNFTLSGPTSMTPNITTVSGTGTTGSLALKTGQYTLSEIVPAGWTLSGLACSVSCSGSCSSSTSQKNFVLTFNMQKNTKITCTFTNKKK